MLLFIILLVCTLYFSIIAPLVFHDVVFIQEIVYVLLALVPAINIIYGFLQRLLESYRRLCFC